MTESKKRRNKYLKDTTRVQQVALSGSCPNGVKKELTYQQALSIILRSRQLYREGLIHANKIGEKQLANQIERCYEQRRQMNAQG